MYKYKPTNVHFMMFSYACVLFYMFRSLLWQSSGCSTVQTPGVQQKSHKIPNKILQNSVHYKSSITSLKTLFRIQQNVVKYDCLIWPWNTVTSVCNTLKMVTGVTETYRITDISYIAEHHPVCICLFMHER